MSSTDLLQEFGEIKCDGLNIYNEDCNKFLLKKELLEHNNLENDPDNNLFLYPEMNDPNFNIKISNKKEFNDNKYDGIITNVEEQADKLINGDFELQPHQLFVRNFMSFQTPYNSLLLYHGLGSGKTCSAIGVCEEMRHYLKQVGINRKIIIIASPNVQDNFRLQLFDERQLEETNGIWTISSCIGNTLLKEINPTNNKNIPRKIIVKQISKLINSSYEFIGYIAFANKIKTNKLMHREYSNSLIVIDEVHNIRKSEEKNALVYPALLKLVKRANNIRLLLLSATPMYNSYKEIIDILNLMNINDRRGYIKLKDIFEPNGEFIANETGEVGRELLIRKVTGYISYVRGENPYTFPYRMYAYQFAPQYTFDNLMTHSAYSNVRPLYTYPTQSMNGFVLEDTIKVLSPHLNKIGTYQQMGYNYIINKLFNNNNNDFFGYTLMQKPLEALIMIYPVPNFDKMYENSLKINPMILPKDVSLKKSLNQIKPRKNYAEEKFDFGKSKIRLLIEKANKNKKVLKIVDDHIGGSKRTKLVIHDDPFFASGEYKKMDEEADEEEADEEEADEEEADEEADEEEADEEEADEEADEEEAEGEEEGEEEEEGDDEGEEGEEGEEDRDVGEISLSNLTGLKGLKRVMSFNESTKRSFQYEPEYERIFAPEHIGKYSCKIKTVCDNIINSEGIILIYSSYIDSGLIPMALALEEMGFKRYGNSKSLFNTPQHEQIDSITLQPVSANVPNFQPATYTIITGDKRISPNNELEVNASTDKDNINGEKVKIILISRAGSEGLDLKYIRQIHILDPWYNMNRIEQIIGRGVRNFSHKDLPFEKRNVQIFLHSTILENENVESADLYLYRMAERKAIQIGKICTLLKKTSVDCIVNHGQTNFTQHNFTNNPVKQILSNNMVIDDFVVGDVPYSSTCDYAKCQYNCEPENDNVQLNIDTYDENFIYINSDKIVQKIKNLMKEKFFYTQKTLISAIQAIKKYPVDQIFAALTYLIDSNSETIIDKYGRLGHLINIGEYYLFQPNELTNPNISIHDRSVPIQFKHDAINVQMETAAKAPKMIISSDILIKMESDYNIATTYMTNPAKINNKTDLDFWYKNCGIVMNNLLREGAQPEIIDSILVEHIVDSLLFEDKLTILNVIYSDHDLTNFEIKVKTYLDTKIREFRIGREVGKCIMLHKFEGTELMRYTQFFKFENDNWIPADEVDIEDFTPLFRISPKELNPFVGYIGFTISASTNLHFKLIKQIKKKKLEVFNLTQKITKNVGVSCVSNPISNSNQLIGYLLEYGDTLGLTNLNIKQNGIQVCIQFEFMLRLFDKNNVDNKAWFLNPELFYLYNF